MDNKIDEISADILLVLKNSMYIGWSSLSSLSIIRIIYFSTLFYSFIYNDDSNPFENTYTFTINFRGPFCNDIDKAIINLLSRENILNNQSQYSLNINSLPTTMNKLPYYEEKETWFKTVIKILSIYGENKIYDLIFRDPEYNDKRKRNQETISTDTNNKSLSFLNKFKSLFEKNLNIKYKSTLSPEQYLKLYFDYVFSKVIKGEELDEA